ncbi:BON domain-containing protein [Burkholderia gladioli]|uniref:BON domain-containing protein n=1 Tax=Burkholderia gladioli TaxID=28095 RepID=UPI003F7AAB02
MKSTIHVVAAAVGAAAMYFLDPAAGQRRRVSLLRGGSLFDGAARDLGAANPAGRHVEMPERDDGMARQRERIAERELGLAARVREAVGRLAGEAGEVEVLVDGGRVRLAGRVPGERRRALVEAVTAIAGEGQVVDQLDDAAPPREVPEAGPGGGVGTGP